MSARLIHKLTAAGLSLTAFASTATATPSASIGKEISIKRHLQEGEEFKVGVPALIEHGKALFTAVWTPQEGGGRPLSKGTGDPLSDPHSPLVFPRNFNRLSAMDSNSCSSCHNTPFVGGGGHFVTNAFIPGQRFDFLTFDFSDMTPTRGAVDERGVQVTLQTATNSRSTLGMFGSGFIEMLARQMTAKMQKTRDGIKPGGSAKLEAKGVSFGVLSRRDDGTWDTSAVKGLPAQALESTGPTQPPSLVIRPFHQAGTVVSLREFTNNAFNHHHGIQASERFGLDSDADGDGFTNEITRADITATTIFQATLAVPGRVIPRDPEIEKAVLNGETRFAEAQCTSCHKASLPLEQDGWIFSEPNPFNPPKNLQPGDAPSFKVDLTNRSLPKPRLTPENGVIQVPAFTDLKLHDYRSDKRAGEDC
ncbi:MAG: hypothetical protein M3Q07_07525 [Pseudobdellovibrionaceae bacterium]|nr:hypothetical protein [Pseudobdellovibrionaceae bacterium]